MADLYHEKVFMLELWLKRHGMDVSFDAIFFGLPVMALLVAAGAFCA